MDIKLSTRSRTPLALIIAALFASPVNAADLVINDNTYDSKSVAPGSVWEGNVIIHNQANGEVTLGNDAVWTGNVTGSSVEDYINRSTMQVNLSNLSAWRGDIQGNVAVITVMDNADFQGSFNVFGDNRFTLSESSFTGNVSASNSGERINYFDYTLSQNSTWVGNINLTSLKSSISLSDQSSWYGDLIQVNSDLTLFGNTVAITNSSLWQGDLTLSTILTSPSNTGSFSVALFNDAIRDGDTTVSGVLTTDHGLFSQSKWYGNLVLSDLDELNTGLVHVVTVYDDSEWVGHISSDEARTMLNIYNHSKWDITGDSKLTFLSGDDSSIVFASPDNVNSISKDYHTLYIDEWSVSDLDITLRAGYYGAKDYGSDKLILVNDSDTQAGATNPVQLTVINNGSDNTHGTEAITIVETVHGLDQFNLTNDVELGGYMYTLEQQGTNWVLVSKTKGPGWQPPKQSSSASAIVNSAAANYLMSYAETDTIYQRMGDLRHNKADGDLWVRSYFGGLDGSETAQLSQFSMNYHGIQLGIDKMWQQSEAQVYAGVMAGMSNSDMDYDYSATQQGEGAIKSHHVGLYAGYTTDNGFYVDSQLKYNFNKNSFSVDDSATNTVSGQDRSRSVLGSVEVGKRFYLMAAQNGLYIEPQLQLTVAYHNSRNVTASNGLAVKMDSFTSTQGRAGAFIGYQVNESETPVNFYIKGNYIKEFDGNIDYSLNGATERLSFDDQRWSHGIGVSVETSQQHNFYLDMEQSVGDRFKQHQLNAGYRYQF